MFNGKRLSGWMALAVFATVGGAMVAADPAFAKVDVDKLTIGGEARVRYEIRTNANFTANEGGTQLKSNASFASHRVRVNVGYDLTPDVTFFGQLQDARNWGSEASATTASGIQAVSNTNANQTGVDLHQGYIQVRNVLVPGLSLKLGRQEITFGDHRLFGNFGWSQVGNSFDAVRLTHSTSLVDVDVFWARVFDTEATASQSGFNNVLFPTSGTTATADQDIYGLYVTLKPTKNWTIEPYWFLLQDTRATLTGFATPGTPTGCSLTAGGIPAGCTGSGVTTATGITTPQAPAQTRSTLGARLNGKQGGMDFTYEGAWQFGSIAGRCARGGSADTCDPVGALGAVPGSRDLHINAHAHALKTGFTFESVPMKPRIGIEFDYASGDNDNNKLCAAANCGVERGDNGNFNTFDNLFPTNHFKYGAMDLVAWRNMVMYQFVFDVKPSPVSKLQFNFNLARLANSRDNWYRGGQGAYAVSSQFNQEASLGQELDVHYWHTFKEKFKFEIGYGHFFAGAYLDKTFQNVDGNNALSRQGATTVNGNAILVGADASVADQNWGYVMGSILF